MSVSYVGSSGNQIKSSQAKRGTLIEGIACTGDVSPRNPNKE